MKESKALIRFKYSFLGGDPLNLPDQLLYTVGATNMVCPVASLIFSDRTIKNYPYLRDK